MTNHNENENDGEMSSPLATTSHHLPTSSNIINAINEEPSAETTSLRHHRHHHHQTYADDMAESGGLCSSRRKTHQSSGRRRTVSRQRRIHKVVEHDGYAMMSSSSPNGLFVVYQFLARLSGKAARILIFNLLH